MTYQEIIIEMIQSALDSLMRTVKAMPEERLTWQPMEVGRTVQDQLAECVQVAGWFERVLTEKNSDFFTREFIVEERRKREGMTMGEIDAQMNPAHERLFAAIRKMSDADLEIKINFKPGFEPTLREVCYFPLRNLWYHFGQVNYMQTLYGDAEMH